MSYRGDQIIVLDNPQGRLVRFLPALKEALMQLGALGLFELGSCRLTPLGKAAHVLANEINPRRAFRRTVEGVAMSVFGYEAMVASPRRPIEQYYPDTEALLSQLIALDIAEIDTAYTKGIAWRLIRD